MIILGDGGFETIIQAAVILLIGIAIIVSNILVIAALLTSTEHRDAMNYYLLSLAVADLLCGVLVVPPSVYAAIVQEWVYGGLLCLLTGYLEVTLWTVTLYTFMWISVDRYLAIRKPLRYETLQTRTRCQCWMVFSWITAALLCCPPLLGYSETKFYRESYICILDWSIMVPYSITLTALVLGPSLITMCYSYSYVFSNMRRMQRTLALPDKEYSTALSENYNNPYHLMSFTLICLFWISWLPFISLQLYELFIEKVNAPFVHFSVTWLGILNSFWKTLVYISMSPQFRYSLRILCATLCCRWKGQQESMCIS